MTPKWTWVQLAALTASRPVPGLEREVAQAFVDAAHQLCPYSNATRGSIDVPINLV